MNEFILVLFIILGRIVEVSIGTIRIVIITKGERKLGSVLAFVEVALWAVLAGSVLSSITEYPHRIIAYAFGFAAGNYLGSILEEKIGIGLSQMQVVLLEKDSAEVTEALRDAGFAVTQVKAQGKTDPRELLILYVPRKRIKECTQLIRTVQENAVITITDSKPIYGGYGFLKK